MLGVFERSYKARDLLALKSHTWRAGETFSSPHYAKAQSPLVEVKPDFSLYFRRYFTKPCSMEASKAKGPYLAQSIPLARNPPGSLDTHGMPSKATSGDTLGIGDLALHQTVKVSRKKSRCRKLRQRKRTAAEGPQALSDPTIPLPEDKLQIKEAQSRAQQETWCSVNATGGDFVPVAITSGAQSPSAAAFSAPPQDHSHTLNGAAPRFVPPIKQGNQQIAPSHRAATSVSIFRKVPPWRVNKSYRDTIVPLYQALQVAPLGQGIRSVTRGIPTTAITVDRLSSPKRGLSSVSQLARGIWPESLKESKSTGSSTPQATQLISANGSPSKQVINHQSFYMKTSTARGKKPLSAPTPTSQYLHLANLPPKSLVEPQRLLLVLDLNGTLLYRNKASSSYRPRNSLNPFLEYCLTNHSVLIWSSATPTNVEGVCKKLFNPRQRLQLLGEWGRDTLDLTSEEYYQKCQVYKRLERIWEGRALRDSHPDHASGGKWSQANTLLLDDSATKAQAQPHNLVELPEFTRNAQLEKGKDILGQVVAYLEEARMWKDVSAFAKRKKFTVDGGWAWDWDAGRNVGDDDEDDQEDGGVRL